MKILIRFEFFGSGVSQAHSSFLPGIRAITDEEKHFLRMCTQILDDDTANSNLYPLIKGLFS